MPFEIRSTRSSLLTIFLIAVAGTAIACQVPVFRYAFEQWDPDRYRVIVLANDDHDEYHSIIEDLGFGNDQKSNANVQIEVMSPGTNQLASRLWKEHGVDGEPVAITLYPGRAEGIGGKVAAVVPANRKGLNGIVESEVRREIVKRLGQGESAVWVLLECGNKEKDQEARAILEKQLSEDSKWLKLPTPEEMEIEPEVLEEVKVKLRVGFSVLALSVDDPNESFLVDALLNSEEDLRQFDEPIAFPIFGRGIVLYALVGKGIAPDTIREASKFICGPCSCQVKEQNPGFDMLMLNDWDASVGGVRISSPLPTTSSTPKLVPIPPGRSSR